MTYRVEVFDNNGRRLGYAWRAALKLRPHGYPHPSAARLGALAYTKRHPAHHCFVNKYLTGMPHGIVNAPVRLPCVAFPPGVK